REFITGLGAATMLMALISGIAWVQWGKADRAESPAPRVGKPDDMNLRFAKPTPAEAEFARMRRNVSRFLADLPDQHQRRGDVGTALLLALESLPRGAGSRPERLTAAVEGGMDGIDRIYAPESELQL